MVISLINKGFAYQSNQTKSVYFRLNSLLNYSILTKNLITEQQQVGVNENGPNVRRGMYILKMDYYHYFILLTCLFYVFVTILV